MALPPLVTLGAFQERYEGQVSGAEALRVEALLRDVSAEVRQVCGRTFALADGSLDVPEVVASATLRAALDYWRNPAGYTAETVGSYSYQIGARTTASTVGGLYLKAEHLAALSPWMPTKQASTGGAYSVPLWA